MATTTDTKPADTKGSNGVLEGLGSVFTRGSLAKAVSLIKKAEELIGPGAGPDKKKNVVNALTREVGRRVPGLAGNKDLSLLLNDLVELVVGEMNKAGELDAVEETGE